MARIGRFVVVVAVIGLLPGKAAPAAQQHNWSGCHFGSPICDNPTPAWGDFRNWLEGTPHIGDDLVFANASRQAVAINTFDNGTRFRSITIGAPHQLLGDIDHGITLDAGITASVGAIVQLPITLNARQTFSVATAGANLVFQGSTINTDGSILDINGPGNIVMVSQITGTASLIKEGTGTLVFVGNHSFAGLIQAREGTVRISGIHSGGMFVEGGRLEGAGTLQGISSSEGFPDFVVAPGGTSPNETAIINFVGNVTFHGTRTFAVDLKGTVAGSGHDQLNVAGTVRIVSSSQLAQLAVSLVNFTPAPGDNFVIVNNQGTDPIEGSVNVPGEFLGRPEGSSFTVGNTTFFITYKGGDGNDIVLHVPTTRTWDGGGADNNWMTGANWVGDIAPAVGDDLIFPAGAARPANVNNFPAGTLFNSITISTLNSFLTGNAIALRAGITNNAASGNTSVAFNSIRLDADQSFTHNGNSNFFVTTPIETNGHRLTMAGSPSSPIVRQQFSRVISGTGGFTMASTRVCTFDVSTAGTPGANTYTGTTVVTAGDLRVRSAQPSSVVEVTGGVLSGRSEVGPLTATGGIVRPFDGVVQTLKVAGNLTFSSGATFDVDVGRDSTAVRHGQLDVAGQVNLGGSTLVIGSNNGAPRLGDEFLIIKNDGTDPVNGTFASRPEGATSTLVGATLQISYQGGDGNDVVLRVIAVEDSRISLIKLTNGTDNDLPPGPFVPVGSTVTFTYLVSNPGAVPQESVFVQDDHGTPGNSGDDLIASFAGGDTNSNGLLDPGETFIFTAGHIATEGQYTNIGRVSAFPQSGGSTVTATNPDNHFGGTPPPASLANISTRLRVQVGDNALIGGVIVTGSTDKKVIVRAIGPTLTGFGVPGALQNPTLELFQGNVSIATNDDWVSSSQMAEIQNSGFAPGNNVESALIATLTPNQNYTAVVRGQDGLTGVGIVEVFDLDPSVPARLANISTRGFVEVDDNVMIAGLIVTPTGASNIKILVRALGPTLGDFGVQGFLANPTLDLVGSNGTVIRSNDNWKDSQQAEIQTAQLAPTHDAEAALVESLPPGAYTAIVRGNSKTTGVGLVEVYNIP